MASSPAVRRAYRAKNIDRIRAQERARNPRRSEHQKERYRRVKAERPEVYAAYDLTQSRNYAVRNLPEPLHEMRLVLFAFRSRIQREAKGL